MSTVWIESRPQRLITLTQVYNPQVILDEIGKETDLRYIFPVLWITLMSPSNSVFMHKDSVSGLRIHLDHSERCPPFKIPNLIIAVKIRSHSQILGIRM